MDRRIRDGRYVIRGLLGEGSQGSTYDGVDLREGRPVAIKRFDVKGARSWKDVELAEREARVLASLAHPLLPRYIEHFEEDGALYLVMEKIEGETIESIVQRTGAMPESEIRRFLQSAASVLDYLHGRPTPVVHRDVKPRNVIRRPDGAYVIVDFGAVTERMRPRGGSTVVGTLGYMAPEQLQGRALPQTDVYAVGATALRALTGADPESLPHRGLRLDVESALGRRVSPELVASLGRMLEPDPDQRASSIAPAAARASAPPPPAPDGRRERKRGKDKPERTPEDSQVRSITGLLWTLWALGWPIVMPIFKEPVIMFAWLAATLVVTWHKGAVIRYMLRAAKGELAEGQSTARGQVRVDLPPQVRVEAAAPELEDAEMPAREAAVPRRDHR